MDEAEMQHRSLPSAADRTLGSGAPPPPAGRRPLDLIEPPPASKTKRPKQRGLTALRCCLGCLALVGLVVAVVLGVFAFGIARALQTKVLRPHIGKHANATLLAAGAVNESELVRPYFSPEGDVSSFDLGIAVHARWDALPSAAETDADRSLDPADGGQGLQAPERNDWSVVYREVVLRNVPLTTKPVQTTVRVDVPSAIVSSLNDPSLHPEMVASFFMLPPAKGGRDPLAEGDATHYSTVRSTGPQYPQNPYLPPHWLANDDDDPHNRSPFAEFFSYAAATAELLHEGSRANASDPGSLSFDVVTRSWVSALRDYPLYNVTAFRSSMADRQDFKSKICPYGHRTPDRPRRSCQRTFQADGHFEQLLERDPRSEGDFEIEMPNERTRYYYAPFMTTDLGKPSEKDYRRLPANGSGFSFDWRITFSTSSLAKAEVAGLFKPVGTSGEWRSNASTYDLAEAHDSAEFWNALIHHPFTPGTRPLIRGFMDLVQGVLRFVHHALLLFYWATRSLSTGISLPITLIDSSFDLLGAVISSIRGYRVDEMPMLGCLFIVVMSVLPLLRQGSLVLRLVWLWGGPRGWVPIGLSRRRSTHSERRSAREDESFLLRERLVVFGVMLVLYAGADWLPSIIHAEAPVDESFAFLSFRAGPDSHILLRALRHLIDPALSSLWFTRWLAQAVLNFQRRTFAGHFRLAIVLLFLADVLVEAQKVLHPILGRSELTGSLGVEGLPLLALEGVLAYQAVVFPAVAQEEVVDE